MLPHDPRPRPAKRCASSRDLDTSSAFATGGANGAAAAAAAAAGHRARHADDDLRGVYGGSSSASGGFYPAAARGPSFAAAGSGRPPPQQSASSHPGHVAAAPRASATAAAAAAAAAAQQQQAAHALSRLQHSVTAPGYRSAAAAAAYTAAYTAASPSTASPASAGPLRPPPAMPATTARVAQHRSDSFSFQHFQQLSIAGSHDDSDAGSAFADSNSFLDSSNNEYELRGFMRSRGSPRLAHAGGSASGGGAGSAEAATAAATAAARMLALKAAGFGAAAATHGGASGPWGGTAGSDDGGAGGRADGKHRSGSDTAVGVVADSGEGPSRRAAAPTAPAAAGVPLTVAAASPKRQSMALELLALREMGIRHQLQSLRREYAMRMSGLVHPGSARSASPSGRRPSSSGPGGVVAADDDGEVARAAGAAAAGAGSSQQSPGPDVPAAADAVRQGSSGVGWSLGYGRPDGPAAAAAAAAGQQQQGVQQQGVQQQGVQQRGGSSSLAPPFAAAGGTSPGGGHGGRVLLDRLGLALGRGDVCAPPRSRSQPVSYLDTGAPGYYAGVDPHAPRDAIRSYRGMREQPYAATSSSRHPPQQDGVAGGDWDQWDTERRSRRRVDSACWPAGGAGPPPEAAAAWTKPGQAADLAGVAPSNRPASLLREVALAATRDVRSGRGLPPGPGLQSPPHAAVTASAPPADAAAAAVASWQAAAAESRAEAWPREVRIQGSGSRDWA
ncbi:hypothetical protein HXX76_013710 [Chlamydomonas incerta]|uniref:Uncharacterized protein n=1 Tax=Chlamydomonas incerta TaxID=51695 RepID=A0A835VU97_CHLIN|nr:hypothetical protein HXX76_013710 [Chlamydomonas incerta]|eukprot:KAG2425501.1 hypothetical protein HXX76_013710 [Chlamydomonas incerta]